MFEAFHVAVFDNISDERHSKQSLAIWKKSESLQILYYWDYYFLIAL